MQPTIDYRSKESSLCDNCRIPNTSASIHILLQQLEAPVSISRWIFVARTVTFSSQFNFSLIANDFNFNFVPSKTTSRRKPAVLNSMMRQQLVTSYFLLCRSLGSGYRGPSSNPRLEHVLCSMAVANNPILMPRNNAACAGTQNQASQ